MIWGTSHFSGRLDAIAYYKTYGFSPADVDRKIRDGEISIGLPHLKPGEQLKISSSGRYWIDDGK